MKSNIYLHMCICVCICVCLCIWQLVIESSLCMKLFFFFFMIESSDLSQFGLVMNFKSNIFCHIGEIKC